MAVTDLNIRIRSRLRGLWWLQTGAWFIRIGCRLLELCRAEVQFDDGEWKPIVAAEVTRLHITLTDVESKAG